MNYTNETMDSAIRQKPLRGVRFEADDAEVFFANLDTLMDVTAYEWYVDDVELNYYSIPEGKYSGQEFKDELLALSGMSFARIRRYPVGSAVDSINTYEDYLKSNCDMLVLFYDGGFYEIYEKEETLVQKTYVFCSENGFQKVEYIRDDNDERYRMYF